MLTRRKILVTLLASLLGLSNCSSPERELPKLSNDLEPLRSVFNQDVGKVRLLLLVDPT